MRTHTQGSHISFLWLVQKFVIVFVIGCPFIYALTESRRAEHSVMISLCACNDTPPSPHTRHSLFTPPPITLTLRASLFSFALFHRSLHSVGSTTLIFPFISLQRFCLLFSLYHARPTHRHARCLFRIVSSSDLVSSTLWVETFPLQF